MAIEHFQNLVIGSGVAGKLLAWTLAKQGQKTVVVERSTPRVAVPTKCRRLPRNAVEAAAPETQDDLTLSGRNLSEKSVNAGS